MNAIAVADCALSASDILKKLHEVEAELGRIRQERWAPRTCDLDLVAVGEMIAPDESEVRRLMALGLAARDEPPPDQLILPHPRMHERSFVLAPMAEVAPDWRHPLLGKTTVELLDDLAPEYLEGLVRL